MSTAHEVCCSGGCGRVLEDAAGNVINATHHRVEGTDSEGTPILIAFCLQCAYDYDTEEAPDGR